MALRRHRMAPLPDLQEQGFAMPLAVAASLALLLGSLSLQSACLQGHLQTGAELDQRQAEDQLFSAANQLLGALNRHHRCLLALPLEQWASQGQDCSNATEQAALVQNTSLGQPYRLLQWQPRPEAAGSVELLLEAPAQGARPSRQAAFAVTLQGSPALASQLLPLGLRGVL